MPFLIYEMHIVVILPHRERNKRGLLLKMDGHLPEFILLPLV